ncbi:hypothetical protein [Marinobacter sp. SS21]|uniref:hypothetical protein n=1 Tax=Marinobacter sp. SS21 TaxID=2979460 RepID=UPI00232D67DF|nr:hypothetical protein [Marinobacter sp. SS21]MDC0663551.1 hypothetical protein [Marinobacter sp. SS21]
MSATLEERLLTVRDLRLSYSSILPAAVTAIPAILERAALVNATLIAGDLSAARQYATDCGTLGHNLWQQIRGNAELESAVVTAVRASATPLQQAVDALPGELSADQLVARALALAQATTNDLPDNLEDILHSVLSEANNHIETVLGSYNLRHYQGLRRLSAMSAIFGELRATWIHCLADFNAAVQSIPILLKGQPIFNNAIFLQHQQVIADFRHNLTSAQRSIKESASNDETLTRADDLVVQVKVGLPNLISVEAHLYVLGFVLRRLGKGEQSEQVGKTAAEAGLLLREALASIAAAKRIAAHLIGLYQDDDVLELLNAAGTRPFDDSSLPNGRNTPIHNLGDNDDGDFVEVRGYVQSISTGRLGSDAKLISRARLKDPSSGASTMVAGLFVHFRHLGISGGSYLIANGIFRSASNLVGNEAAVELDRLSLSELAGSRWRIGFLRLSDPWFQQWRNGANMSWSWGVHRPLAKTEGVGPEGASEPIFTPFLRGS